MHTLRPSLPVVLWSSVDANVTFFVRSLDSVYTSTASSSATKGYLEELQAIANRSGRSFQTVLQEELMKMSTGEGVNLPAEISTPVEDPKPNSHDSPGRPDASAPEVEAESIKTPLPAMRKPSLLLESVSPAIINTLPAVFPPSPSLRCAQLGLRGDAQAALAPSLSRPHATTRSPQVMSSLTTANSQSEPIALGSGNSNTHDESFQTNKVSGDDGAAAPSP